jgi:hypothetical protein
MKLLILLLSFCSILSGCVDPSRVDVLEKRVTALETQIKVQQNADSAQHQAWLSCRDEAGESFNEGLRLDGEKVAHKPNRYWVDPAAYDNLQTTWRDAIADCDRQYPKR